MKDEAARRRFCASKISVSAPSRPADIFSPKIEMSLAYLPRHRRVVNKNLREKIQSVYFPLGGKKP